MNFILVCILLFKKNYVLLYFMCFYELKWYNKLKNCIIREFFVFELLNYLYNMIN